MQVNHRVTAVDVLEDLGIITRGTEGLAVQSVRSGRRINGEFGGVGMPHSDGDGVGGGAAVLNPFV